MNLPSFTSRQLYHFKRVFIEHIVLYFSGHQVKMIVGVLKLLVLGCASYLSLWGSPGTCPVWTKHSAHLL